jgi:hypothetical protein
MSHTPCAYTNILSRTNAVSHEWTQMNTDRKQLPLRGWSQSRGGASRFDLTTFFQIRE